MLFTVYLPFGYMFPKSHNHHLTSSTLNQQGKKLNALKGQANRSCLCLSVTVRLTSQSQNCTVGWKVERDKCVQTFSRSGKDLNDKPITKCLFPKHRLVWNDMKGHSQEDRDRFQELILKLQIVIIIRWKSHSNLKPTHNSQLYKDNDTF